MNVDLIVPESNWKGAASAPVGVTGAGSNAVPHASLSIKEPYAGVSPVILSPNAVNERLNLAARFLNVAMPCSFTAPTELPRHVSDRKVRVIAGERC